jgi:hypothetical protein
MLRSPLHEKKCLNAACEIIFLEPDDGFLKKPKHVAINYTVRYHPA